MKFAVAVSLGIFCTLLAGCDNLVDITNNGPNPVTITANPSPDNPPLPVEIPVGETVTLEYVADGATINAVDMTTFNFDTLDLDFLETSIFELEWDGTELKDVTP